MKRTPIRRRSPLRPRHRPRHRTRRRPRTKYARRVRDFEYMGWVKTLECVARHLDPEYPCGGVVEADHAGRRAMGRKCPDVETIPICTEHHRQRTDFSGAFRVFNRTIMRAWLDASVGYTQHRWRTGHNIGSEVWLDGNGNRITT